MVNFSKVSKAAKTIATLVLGIELEYAESAEGENQGTINQTMLAVIDELRSRGYTKEQLTEAVAKALAE